MKRRRSALAVVLLVACGGGGGGPLRTEQVMCTSDAVPSAKPGEKTYFGAAYCKHSLDRFLRENPGIDIVHLVPLTPAPGTPEINGTSSILVVYRGTGKYDRTDAVKNY
jgi:hypothetical protein